MTYSTSFYDTIRSGVQASTSVVVPLVMEHIHPRRVADIGCGEGWWAHRFAEHGCKTVGVDGGYVQFIDPFEDLRFIAHDLCLPLPALGEFDLAVSLEVAEHLPPSRAAGFVAELCALAPVVMLSAAIPGQGGTGHVNEQPLDYWVQMFEDRGYAVSGALRWMMWGNPLVENWYQQNTIIATSEPDRYPTLFDTPLATPWPVVHPILFDARRPR